MCCKLSFLCMILNVHLYSDVSEPLFFSLDRLTINHMMELQYVRLFLSQVWSQIVHISDCDMETTCKTENGLTVLKRFWLYWASQIDLGVRDLMLLFICRIMLTLYTTYIFDKSGRELTYSNKSEHYTA